MLSFTYPARQVFRIRFFRHLKRVLKRLFEPQVRPLQGDFFSEKISPMELAKRSIGLLESAGLAHGPGQAPERIVCQASHVEWQKLGRMRAVSELIIKMGPAQAFHLLPELLRIEVR